MLWLIALAIGIVVLYLLGGKRGKKQVAREKTLEEILAEENASPTMTTQKARQSQMADDPLLVYSIQIEQAWRRGDFDWARAQLQKIAYGMVNTSVTDAQRAQFKALMTEFASEDPLYRDVMLRLRPLVRATPGLLQSEIYKGQPDDIKEKMRYVLYFAESLGDLIRHKKGRSYRLYLPDQIDRIGH